MQDHLDHDDVDDDLGEDDSEHQDLFAEMKVSSEYYVIQHLKIQMNIVLCVEWTLDTDIGLRL